jgi:hypothetical protein
VAARKLAVEAHAHESTRPQDRDQHPPAFERIGEMVQHAASLDEIEGLADRPQLQNIGLRISQTGQSQRARLSLRIAEAGQAEIDRKRIDAAEPLGGFDRVLTGPTAGPPVPARRRIHSTWIVSVHRAATTPFGSELDQQVSQMEWIENAGIIDDDWRIRGHDW